MKLMSLNKHITSCMSCIGPCYSVVSDQYSCTIATLKDCVELVWPHCNHV